MDDLFDLTDLPLQTLFQASPYPWVWLRHLNDALPAFPPRCDFARFPGVDFDEREGRIHVEDGVTILPGAHIYGPVYIAAGVTIGHNALVRGGCLICEGCFLGHAVEVKHSILLPHATCGHRNYVGDSVLGHRVNMGDGSGIANLRADRDPTKTIKVGWKDEVLDTGMRKLGAFVGDDGSIGCRATLQPGTILGRESLVYPNIAVGRTHPPRTVLRPSYTIIAEPRDS